MNIVQINVILNRNTFEQYICVVRNPEMMYVELIPETNSITYIKLCNMNARYQSCKNLLIRWMEDDKILSYTEFGLYPNLKKCPANVFNMFCGFEIHKIHKEISKSKLKELVQPILDHLGDVDTLTVNPKGIRPFQVLNFATYYFMSNRDTPLKIEIGDRRYCVAKMLNTYKCNIAYCQKLTDYIEQPDVLSAWYDYLMNVQYESKVIENLIFPSFFFFVALLSAALLYINQALLPSY
ncbi:MAG: hypothetical protein EOO53_21720 [Gammaproteobacteria bacterium]|nr:MAG: hypothetical protein EOO53_21720 [Gammaproteobacteria bacterium]